jgi:hypothetical protein
MQTSVVLFEITLNLNWIILENNNTEISNSYVLFKLCVAFAFVPQLFS